MIWFIFLVPGSLAVVGAAGVIEAGLTGNAALVELCANLFGIGAIAYLLAFAAIPMLPRAWLEGRTS